MCTRVSQILHEMFFPEKNIKKTLKIRSATSEIQRKSEVCLSVILILRGGPEALCDTLSAHRSWPTASEASPHDTCHTSVSAWRPKSHQWHDDGYVLTIPTVASGN